MRFKYESTGLLRKTALRIAAPHQWRTSVRPWVFDTHSGFRFQLTESEESVINCLANCVARRGASTNTDAAFDYVADAIVRRRIGYGTDWRSLANWTSADWDGWINAAEERQVLAAA